ncbi:MAG: isocitrate lyase [Acidimicrobiia bacterium]|nr:isocitrate lyase [Acidimicrobiia bacterium]
MQADFKAQVEALEADWRSNPRWIGIERPYTAEDVVRLRGSVLEQMTLAARGARRLWTMMEQRPYVNALGAMTGGQATQMVKAGLEAIYLSGWQVAGDANLAAQVYPDQSLYPANSAPALVRRINNALQRADQIHWGEGDTATDWLVPIMADGEAGFGGPLNVFELTKEFIRAGAAGIHLEDQLSSAKKCGHMGGKVLVPTQQHIQTLVSARLAGDVMGVPLIVACRTDSLSATLLTSDIDDRDREFVTGERSAEGFYYVRNGLDSPIARALAYAPYSDVIWCETSTPDLEEARQFAEAVHKEYPGKKLMYNCSPSFNWKRHLDDETIARFQNDLGEMGYAFQFITLAGFHSLNESMFSLAVGYKQSQMAAYVKLQEREFALEAAGYSATKHQREVGAGYFDDVATVISGGTASTLALVGSTEEQQF